MFVQRRKFPKTIDFSCDGCSSEFLETDCFNLSDASHALRAAGWAIVEMQGHYYHYCNGCAVKKGVL